MLKRISLKKESPTQHIDETDFLIVDVETTGLSPEYSDRVCEIGAVKLRGSAVIETFGTLIDPQRPVSSGAYAINRISPEMLRNAPAFSEVADRLWQLMQDSVLVAYNAPFDLSFLVNEFRLLGYPEIKNPIADALALARQLLGGLGKYPQENVARAVGIPFPVKHRALEDAMVTAKIFTLFCSILKAHDCTLVSDLTRRDLAQVLYERRMSIVKQALGNGKNLWIKYLSPRPEIESAEITDRVISPKHCPNPRQLVAYCHLAQAERNFRIDRILDIRLMEQVSI
ncbi:MAG: hypothetical protein HY707_03310 [Ignavibacteriae bacterium]|nr:hypothetical protein [Ignavibacteriota bacterium]